MSISLTVFDQIVYQFETISTSGAPTIRAMVMATFWMLATIDACMAFLTNLEDGNHFKILISKCLKIGFWLFVLKNWGMLCNVIRDSLMQVGTAIGGGGDISVMKHPSSIVSMGFTTADPIIEYINTFNGVQDILANLPLIAACIISYLFTCLAYCIVGVQVVLTYAEFYLAVAMFVVFVPMGVTKWTSFLAEKAIGGVIAYGVKLMVAACVVGNIKTMIEPYTYTPITSENALTFMVSLVCVSILMAFLAWQIPGLAASVMTGGPSITAGSVVQTAAGAAVAAAGMGAISAGVAGKAIGGSSEGNSSKGSTQDAAGAINTNSGSSSSSGSNTGNSGTSASSSSSNSPTFSGGGGASYGGQSSSNVYSSASGNNTTSGSNSGGSSSGNSSTGSNNGSGNAANKYSSGSGNQSSGGYGNSSISGSGSSDGSGAGDNSSESNAGSGAYSDGNASSSGAEGVSGPSFSGGNTSSNGIKSGSKQSPNGSIANSMSKVVNAANISRSVIPQEVSPKGSMTAPLPRD